MRRFLLVFTVITFSGWSQPAQPQAQPPIVVKVEMPPTNPWLRMVELLVPGIIGAGIALLGVWLTNKNNAATNEANREHALDIEGIKAKIAAEAKSRDNRWEFRKDVYVRIITSVVGLIDGYAVIKASRRLLQPTMSDEGMQELNETHRNAHSDLALKVSEFHISAALAPIATADLIIRPFLEADVFHGGTDYPEYDTTLQSRLNELSTLLGRLQVAGCKDLWDSPEPEVKAELAT